MQRWDAQSVFEVHLPMFQEGRCYAWGYVNFCVCQESRGVEWGVVEVQGCYRHRHPVFHLEAI